jgi:hypothetical protein
MLIDKNDFPKIKQRVRELKRKQIQVGILGEQDLAMVAHVNEYGAKIGVTEKMRNYLNAMGLHLKATTKYIIIPERSFLRTSFDDRKNLNKVFGLAEDVFILDRTINDVCDRIGLFMTGAIQKKIKSNIPPGNHPFTTEQKGGKNKTLINTGRLGQGITHKIV